MRPVSIEILGILASLIAGAFIFAIVGSAFVAVLPLAILFDGVQGIHALRRARRAG